MRKKIKNKTMAGILATSMILGEIALPVSYQLLQDSVVYAQSNLLTYKENGFDIENGVLRRYNGQESDLEIPEGVIKIGDYAFERNETVKTITFPDSLTTVGSYAFARCKNLKTVNTNEKLEEIGDRAFIMNESLETIDLSHVKTIGYTAFNICRKLEKIDLSSAEFIDSYAFHNTGIKEVDWEVKGDFVEKEGTWFSGIFSGCTALKKVHLSGKVTIIPDVFFENCTALEEIQIDTMDEITNIGRDAFLNTPWQQKKMEENEDHMFIVNDILVKYLPNTYYAGEQEEISDTEGNITEIRYSYSEPKSAKMEEVVIPETVKKIGPKAFYGAYSVKNITFPKGIEEVGEAAFDYTKWLEEYLEKEHYLIFNKHLVKIWNQLEKVEIPSNVTHINSDAYPGAPMQGCRADIIPKTKEVIVPVTVTEIEGGGLPEYDSVNNKGYADIDSVVLPESFKKKDIFLPMGAKVQYKDVESSITGKDLSGDITTKPSQSPTAIPSQSPTVKPSQSPTAKPSQSPTAKPSQSPTAKPSQSPTAEPSQSPTAKPSQSPTTKPSQSPTTKPSQSPTTKPSQSPTAEPSQSPTAKPSQSPMATQTQNPIVTPSQSPVVPTPAVKNTVLKDTKNKCRVKVASASVKNPTVIYIKSTNAKASSIKVPATVTINRVTYKVTGIAASAFSGNKRLTKVTIGKNITLIGRNAFKNCSKLRMIRIQSSVLKSVGSKALKGTNKKLVIKAPSKKVSAYKKLFKGKGNGKMKVKK